MFCRKHTYGRGKIWNKLKEPEKFDSWLAQIVVNTAKNELEKRNHTSLDLRMESGEEEDAEIMDQAVSVWENEPELECTKEETRQLVHELIDAVTVGVISYNKSNVKNATSTGKCSGSRRSSGKCRPANRWRG